LENSLGHYTLMKLQMGEKALLTATKETYQQYLTAFGLRSETGPQKPLLTRVK